MCVILGLAVIVGAIAARIPTLVVVGLAPFLYLYAIGARLSASIDDDGFHYRGWFRSVAIPWREVVSAQSTDNLPYPYNRYYGPVTYVIRTADKKVVVNMLYFSDEFARAFHVATKRLGRAGSMDS
jgi:hypothetical protein